MKIKFSFYLKVSYSSLHSIKMSKIFRRSGNLSQKLKPIMIEDASYCIQFEILKNTKISQSSEQIIIDLSEWRELESKIIREFRKELAMSKSTSRKNTGFHIIQMKNISMKLLI